MSWMTPLTSLRRLATTSGLGQEVCYILSSPNVHKQGLTHCNWFTNCMVANGIALFLQDWFRSRWVGHLGLIITLNVSGPRQRDPIIQILYLSPLSVSIPCFMATNSAPKTEVSIVACCFDSQMTGAKLQKMINPVQEHQVLFSPTWSLSTIIQRSTSLPRGGGMSGGVASSTLP